MEALMTRSEVAYALGIHPNTLKKFARQGQLNEYKVGREARFIPSEVIEAVRSGRLEINQDEFMKIVRSGRKMV